MASNLHLGRVAYFSRFVMAGIVYHAIVDEHTAETACGFNMVGHACELVKREAVERIRGVLCGVCEDDLATTVPARVVFTEPQWRPYDG